MNNLELYNIWRAVPANAQRTIQGGNLNGKTDINAMWRIKVLTETFGPCGFGWTTKITEHWTDEKVLVNREGREVVEVVAWVRLELRVNYKGEWSQPIEGIGGSKYAGKGRGDELNDEAFKMAETDAISVACKKLGVGADIYWASDATKYTTPDAQQGQKAGKSATSTRKAAPTPAAPSSREKAAEKYKDDQGFWMAVEGQATGRVPDGFRSSRDWFVQKRNPDNGELAYFDSMVELKKAALGASK